MNSLLRQALILVEPENNFAAGGAVRLYRWRNPKTNDIKAIKNRAQGVCLSCAKRSVEDRVDR